MDLDFVAPWVIGTVCGENQTGNILKINPIMWSNDGLSVYRHRFFIEGVYDVSMPQVLFAQKEMDQLKIFCFRKETQFISNPCEIDFIPGIHPIGEDPNIFQTCSNSPTNGAKIYLIRGRRDT